VGFRKSVIDQAAISNAFAEPIDTTLPTPVCSVMPVIPSELAEAGKRNENIRFIHALGIHYAMTNNDFRNKLGETMQYFPLGT
jgi:nickel-dependent lactate racemase